MLWKPPHISKIYEAITAIADDRIKLITKNQAKCYSSSRNKYYLVEYDPINSSITSNDNTAYYTKSLSYPMIALLMLKGVVPYSKNLLKKLKGIYWKDINQKYKNNYDLAIEHVLSDIKSRGVDVNDLKDEINNIYTFVCNLKIHHLGETRIPSKKY